MSPCWLLLGQLMACLFTEGTASTSHTAQPNFPLKLNMSVPVKCCHHSTVGTPSSLYSSKKCSSTGLTSFLKLPSLGIVTTAGFCGENRTPSIDASCFCACSESCSCSSYACLIDFIVFGERARTNGLDKSTQSSGFGLFLADNSSRTRESVDLDVAVGFTFEAL